MALAVCLCLCATAFSDEIKTYAGSGGISMEYETSLFDTEIPLDINIIMDSADWEDMLSNATAEEYKECNVEINGTTFYRVGIRPKGNTSLSSIASDPTTDRYSFKLEFDKYVDGQTCFGLDKLVLNNNYADATNMKEALIYDMFKYTGADASLYNYAKININGEYWGVYLALESVEDSFLLRNYGVQSGELYKPESMNIGGGKGDKQGERPNENMTPPENKSETSSGGQINAEMNDANAQEPNGGTAENTDAAEVLSVSKETDETASGETAPTAESNAQQNDLPGENKADNVPGGQGGFSMSSGGADLNYTDDDLDSYSTIWDGEVTDSKKADRKRVVTALKNISEGTELEKYMDIDNLARYMAVHVFSVNDDSLSGSMAHNYYLYESGGKLNLIPWDYNLAFGGMGGGNNATSVVNEAIDNAFSVTDFFDTLTANEEYNALYYDNLKKVVEYINGGEFEKFYSRVRSQIDSLVKSDPTAFYSYDEYIEAAETLYELVKLRGESIEKQISGEIPSTAEAQKSVANLIDASSLNLNVLGSMNNGGGKGGFDVRQVNNAAEKESTEEKENAASATAESESAAKNSGGDSNSDSSSQTQNAAGANGSPPSLPDGQAPGGMAPPDMGNGVPGETPSAPDFGAQNTQSESQTTAAAQNSSAGESSSSADNSESESQTTQNAGDANGMNPGNDFFGGGQMTPPGMGQNSSSGFNAKNFTVYGICLAIILLFLLFAALYKRRPGKG